MWTGTEWIPAPPSGKPVSQNHDITNAEILGQISQSSEGGNISDQKLNLQDVSAHEGVEQTSISKGPSSQELKVSDTAIMGDLTQKTTILEQSQTNPSAAIDLMDSVVSGDINVSQNVNINSIQDIVLALKEIGITKESHGRPIDSDTKKAAVKIASQVNNYDHEISSLSIEEAMSIISATSLAGDFQSSKLIINEILGGKIETTDTWDFVFAKACLGEIELMLGNIEAADNILFSAFKEAGELNDSFLIAYTTLPLMRLMITSGEFERALEVGHSTLELSIGENDFDLQASLLNSLGAIYHIQGNLELANQFFENSLKLMLEHESIDIDPVIYRNLGIIAYDLEGNIDKSVHLLSNAYQIYLSHSNEVGMIDVNNSLGRIFMGEGDLENGFAKFTMAYKLGKQIDVVEIIGTCSMNLGTCCLRQNNLDLAERYYREAIVEFRKINHFHLINAQVSLAELEQSRNNLLMAKTHFSNALEEANKRNATQLESEILVELAMIAEQQNNSSEQRMYNERAVEIWRQNGQTIPQWYIDNGY